MSVRKSRVYVFFVSCRKQNKFFETESTDIEQCFKLSDIMFYYQNGFHAKADLIVTFFCGVWQETLALR